MSNVSVLGLGVMGSALSRALLEHGNGVTVWNRTAAKAEPLERAGARRAVSAAQAVAASPVVIVCVLDYEQSAGLLEGAELAGRTLVQLSTGSPRDARSGEVWARERGAEYLDGAILATPRQIGTPESVILVSGSARAFESSREVLSHTAGAITYLGEPVAAAAAFDLAFLSLLFPALAGLYQALRVVQAEGLAIADFAGLVEASGPALTQMFLHDARTVASGEYTNPEASIDTCQRALASMVRSAREAGLNASIPSFVEQLFSAAQRAGLGAESPAALFKLLERGV